MISKQNLVKVVLKSIMCLVELRAVHSPESNLLICIPSLLSLFKIIITTYSMSEASGPDSRLTFTFLAAECVEATKVTSHDILRGHIVPSSGASV